MVSRPPFPAGDSLVFMAKTALRPARASARILAFVVPSLVVGLALVALVTGCAETRRPLGEACLKSEDCLSGICSQFACVAAPPLINDEPDAEAGPPAATDAAADSPAVDAAPETSTAPEASPEAAAD